MASAVLPSRNEQCWGERKAYMRNYPNNPTNNTRNITRFNPKPSPSPDPYPNTAQSLTHHPNSNLIRRTHDPQNHLRQNNEPPQRLPPLPPLVFSDSQLSHRKPEGTVLPKDPFHREYLTFNLASYSKEELKELKKRLMSELQSVRSLLTRIETRPIESRPGSHNPQFRPPSVQVSHHASEPSAEKRTPKRNQRSRSSGFVTRNDKNNKKISGKKRVLPFASGPDSKRPVVPESEVKKVADAMMMKCKQILMKLMKLKHACVFSKPVDVQGLKLHDYYQIVKEPMDLGTVKSRLNKREYQTPLDFASDVRLTFQNALKYNPKGHDVHTLAETMLLKFEKLFRSEYQKYEAEYPKVMAENPVNQNSSLAKPMPMVEESDLMMHLQPTVISSPPVQVAALVPSMLQVDEDMVQLKSGKLPQPKAKDPNKRLMTSEEKLKLVSDLDNIPQEKMEQIIQIVGRRNPQLLQEGGEIELDIEALDVETLRELDRFVNHHKKTRGKISRQDLIEKASVNAVENASINEVLKSPVNEPPPPPEVPGQKNKKWDAGEEDVDIGEEIPANNFPPVEIEKDPAGASRGSSSSGSSSSSSDDSSSSSDSDSGSSGSDSDEDSVQSPYVEPKGTPAT